MTPSDAGSATSDGLAAESREQAEARIMQEWRWGNLTVLGVANHLRRAGFNLRTATDKANALSPPSAPGDVGALVERLLVTVNGPFGVDSPKTHINPDGPAAAAALSASTAEVEALRGALDAIATTGVLRDVKWAGMTARDIAEAALTSPDGGRNG